MKTFTVRGLDEELDSKLKDSAKSQSMSVNQWILRILRQAMGLEKERKHTHKYHDLDFLFGAWSEEEYRAFQKSEEFFERIDHETWK